MNALPDPTGFNFEPTDSDDYEMFAGHPVTFEQFSQGVMVGWDLKNPKKLRDRLEEYSASGVYVFAQAYPYNSPPCLFEAARARLLRLYRACGFIEASGGFVYRPPQQ